MTGNSKICGIYRIKNELNGKVYIGQSKRIFGRWNEHLRSSFPEKWAVETKRDQDLPLHRSIRKYGIENFSFAILEICSPEKLNDKEKEYIKKYESDLCDKGYNLASGGQDSFALAGERHSQAKLTQHQVDEIIDMLSQGIPLEEISQKFKVSKPAVCNINTGKNWHSDDRQYPIHKYEPLKGEQAGQARLTDEQVMAIRNDFADGDLTLQQIADKHGIQYGNTVSICYGYSWTHLPVFKKGQNKKRGHVSTISEAEMRESRATSGK